jgi:HK97 gp10 family phage protein
MPNGTNITTQVDTRRLNQILRDLPGNAAEAVRTTAFAVESKAKQKAPVDTGALRASIYTATNRTGGTSPGNQTLPQPNDPLTANVGPSMDYAPHVELGTNRSAAQPYLVPAVREVENDLAGNFKKVVTG